MYAAQESSEEGKGVMEGMIAMKAAGSHCKAVEGKLFAQIYKEGKQKMKMLQDETR